MGSRRCGAALLVVLTCAGTSRAADKAVREAIARLRSHSWEVRRDAALTLSRMGLRAKRALRPLIRALGDTAVEVRDAAGEAIVAIGPGSVPDLIRGLSNRSAGVRERAARLLARFPRKLGSAAIRTCIPYLADKSAKVREAVADLLAAAGVPAIDMLLRALAVRGPEGRDAAVRALAGIGKRALPRLEEALRSAEDPLARVGAARALGGMGPKAKLALPALEEALNDPVATVAAAAADAAGGMGDAAEDAIPRLVRGLEDPREVFRKGCIDGLAKLGKFAAPACAEALKASSVRLRAGARQALLGMPETGPPALVDLLAEGPPRARREALVLVRRFGFRARLDELVDAVVDCLKNPQSDLRKLAALALARIGGPARRDATERLIAILADKDASVRAAAAGALGELNCKARKEVARAEHDPDPAVRAASFASTWQLGGDRKRALDALRKLLARDDARAAAAHALERMGIAAAPAIPDLTALLEDASPRVRVAAAAALGACVRPGAEALANLRGAWKKQAPLPVRRAIEAGLGWLAAHQDRDQDTAGRWDADDFMKHDREQGGGKGLPRYDVGVTSLALWTFAGAADERYSETLHLGLDALLRAQRPGGLIGGMDSHEFLVMHALSTAVLAEAWMLDRDSRCLRGAREGVVFIEQARNPSLAWRYAPRGGDNDTHVTTWMVTALRLAERAGVFVDPAAFEGAARWLSKMTEPDTGRTGYNYPGGLSARTAKMIDRFPAEKTGAMTAARLWAEILLFPKPHADPTFDKGIALCAGKVPDWGLADLYFWHFGTLALLREKSRAARAWRERVQRMLLLHQHPGEEESVYRGSWDPIGAWGASGGRVYSTAIAVLTLLAPYRYPEGFPGGPMPRAVRAALQRAGKDEIPEVREAAEAALRRIAFR